MIRILSHGKKYLYVFGTSILLIGFDESTNHGQKYQSHGEIAMSDNNITDQKKMRMIKNFLVV
jgi:hypothetical protein